MKFRFSLKWKLIIWLTAIGFITSIAINYSFVYFGYSKINHTMKQLPIINWHNQVILEPLKMLIPNNIPLRDNQKIRSFLQSLTKIKAHKVFHDDELFTNVSISAFVVVDLDSKLLIQTSSSSLLEGDISNQIPIQSRDDLSDAITGRYNSGIESIGNNQYLVIKKIRNSNNNIVGALLSWQIWQVDNDQEPFFYISSNRAFFIALMNTLASYIWIFPSTLILAWLVAKLFARRYHSFYTTVESWGKGELKERISITGTDEISDSFAKLNQMADRFDENREQVKQLIGLEERQNLAAELHDTVKQQLFASNLQLATALQLAEDKPKESTDAIRIAISQNQLAFKQVNDLIMALTPLPISHSLNESLEQVFNRWRENQDIKLEVVMNLNANDTVQEPAPLTQIQQQVVYRSIVECLQNISKHSSADRASVTVQRSSNCIKWSVTDNGDSSNIITSNTEIIMGQGLNLMKNQILSLNGIFMLSTSNGFEIKAEFRL